MLFNFKGHFLESVSKLRYQKRTCQLFKNNVYNMVSAFDKLLHIQHADEVEFHFPCRIPNQVQGL